MGRSFLLVSLTILSCCTPVRAQQIDRRSRMAPELVVESGGRMGTCDALTFTRDGRFLLAVGDDKVVRYWPCGADGLELARADVLRWSSWRERRGAIYALALSPDAENRQIAVAGFGLRTGTAMVLDRATGQVLHALTNAKGIPATVIRSLAFSPSGKQVAIGDEGGGIWAWDVSQDSARRLEAPVAEGTNRVRLLAFRDENTLLSVREDGSVLQWDVKAGKAQELFRLKNLGRGYFRVILSPDGKWLAGGAQGPLITLRPLSGAEGIDIELSRSDFVRSLAFSPDGRQLAAGIGNARGASGFYNDGDDRLALYDLTTKTPTRRDGPRHAWHADALAFHPDGRRLAVAGGDNHEVRLWDLTKLEQPVNEVRSAGSGLWGVALSRDGRYLAFQEQREPNPSDPNHRGQKPWRIFDLPKRTWVRGDDAGKIELRQGLDRAGGWTVRTDRSPTIWSVVSPEKQEHPLPWNPVTDSLPRCWTFLPAQGGKPLRLAVGHLYGFSIFDLSQQPPRRSRVCSGHSGEVMALAATVDRDGREWLVSASSDQTVAAWALDDWPSNPELGAAFAVKGERLVVKTIDVGGPAWEAGLVEGDEIARLLIAGQPVEGKPADWLKRLRYPVPGVELYFEGLRGKEEMRTVTTVRQRPLWRFFPTRDEDWILWMWRHYYYDTSTNGDSLIGWHVNNRNPDREPAFYKAEQFRQQFHRPDVLDKLLTKRALNASELGISLAPVDFGQLEPPPVQLRLAANEIKDGEVKVRLTVAPRDLDPDHVPRRVELWINDYRFRTFDAEGKPFDREVAVPAQLLRAGANQVTLQSFTRLEGRTEVSAPLRCDRVSTAKPRLFGLFVGINDYSKSGPSPDGKRGLLGDLTSARRDAEVMHTNWLGQKGKLYQDAAILLADERPRRADLLKQLAELAGQVGPDDRLVLFLAGHGEVHKNKEGKSVFVFCCSDYDRARPADTGLTSDDLYEALAKLPCRKLVFLDACRSGDLALNPIRSLTPAGKGPIILAACDPTQYSFENPDLKHGLFTYAVLDALGKSFAQADKNGDGELTAAEIYAHVRKQMPDLLRAVNQEGRQHPVCFPRVPEAYPLAGK